MTTQERLEELYTIAFNEGDVHTALEIADRIKALPVENVVDSQVTEVIGFLDELVHYREHRPEDGVDTREFDYAGHAFSLCLKDT